MANPFVALESVPVMATITDMLQRQANLKQTETRTNIENAHLNILNQQQQMEQQYRDALLKGETLDPSKNNPATTSIADGDQGGPGQAPAGGFIASLQNEKKQVAANIALAQKYPYSEEAQKNLKLSYERMDHIDTNLREAMKDQSKDQQQDLGKVANMLQDVKSPADLTAVRDFIGQTKGRDAALAFDRQFPHDPNTGELLWNDPAKKVAKNYLNSAIGAKDKMELADKDREYQRKVLDDERKVQKDRDEAKFQNAEIATRRAGIAAANERSKRTLERLGGSMDYKLFKDTQTEINRNADQYKIRDYQKGLEVATRAESALTDPARGYADVTAPAARTLADQFKLMIDNYRSRTGGKYQEQELGKMNGLLQKLDKFTETIGEGDKLLAKDVMLQTSQEMKKLALDRHADVVKTELKYAKSLRDRGTDPLPLTTFGDIEALKKNNVAKQVTVNGKDYLVFGKDKADQFEMPSAPERPRYLPYENPTE